MRGSCACERQLSADGSVLSPNLEIVREVAASLHVVLDRRNAAWFRVPIGSTARRLPKPDHIR